MKPDTDSPEFRLSIAMVAVEEAQTLLAEAAELISPIHGPGDEWDELCALHAKTKQTWYRLEMSEHRTTKSE